MTSTEDATNASRRFNERQDALKRARRAQYIFKNSALVQYGAFELATADVRQRRDKVRQGRGDVPAMRAMNVLMCETDVDICAKDADMCATDVVMLAEDAVRYAKHAAT